MSNSSTTWTSDGLTNASTEASDDTTISEIIQQIEAVFGRQPQPYMFRLINDGLNEISSKCKSYKTSRTTDLEVKKRWYQLHNSQIDITKVEIKDTDGRYVKIPKLIDPQNILKDDSDEANDTLV